MLSCNVFVHTNLVASFIDMLWVDNFADMSKHSRHVLWKAGAYFRLAHFVERLFCWYAETCYCLFGLVDMLFDMFWLIILLTQTFLADKNVSVDVDMLQHFVEMFLFCFMNNLASMPKCVHVFPLKFCWHAETDDIFKLDFHVNMLHRQYLITRLEEYPITKVHVLHIQDTKKIDWVPLQEKNSHTQIIATFKKNVVYFAGLHFYCRQRDGAVESMIARFYLVGRFSWVKSTIAHKIAQWSSYIKGFVGQRWSETGHWLCTCWS